MPNGPKSTREGPPVPPSSLPDAPGPAPARREAALKPPAKTPSPAAGRQDGPPAGRQGDVKGRASEPAHPGVPLSPPGIVPESDVRLHTPSAAAPQPEHGKINDGLGELPWSYGDARLIALVRDPATLFVYWDFSQQQIEQAFAGLGPARAVLRLFSTRGGDLVREAEVHLDARGWYVRDLPAGTEARAELWAVGPNGARMLRAARPVRLPPAWPSDVLEAFYIKIPLDQPLPQNGLSAGRPLNYGGSYPPGWERRVQPRAFSGSSHGGPFGSSPGNKLPWSMTHLVPDLDGGEQ